MTKVVKVDSEGIEFQYGIFLFSHHETDCCESHYLDFSHLTLNDFEGLEFDLSSDSFFEKIEGYGIELKPVFGHSIKIPGYGDNNGYYSSNLTLWLSDNKDFNKQYDISDCQEF